MRWEALLRPVGPEPPSVYWWRRGGVLAAVFVFVLLIAYACSGSSPAPKKGSPARASSSSGASSSTTPSASSGASASTVSAGACDPAHLLISAAMSVRSYAVGASPTIDLAVGTNGTTPCSADLQPAVLTVLITSGPARIWSNADCAHPAPQPVVLRPGVAHNVSIVWDRTRSQPQCPSAVTSLRAQPGTYVASVTFSGKTIDNAFAAGGSVFSLR
jgi:hypothetical protein